jgi:hypothetical protein
MVEQEMISAARAARVREILLGLGVPQTSLNVSVNPAPATPDGVNDPWSRKVTLSVKK